MWQVSNQAASSTTKRNVLKLLAGSALFFFWRPASAQTAAAPDPQLDAFKAQLENLQQLLVPVGGVVMWWGKQAAIPPNFEICDGASVTTPGALLQTPKPDLRDRFVKGAAASTTDVTQSQTGGQHQIPDRQSGETILSVDQMPSHNHQLNDPGHIHDVHWGHNPPRAGYSGLERSNEDANDPAHPKTFPSTTGITLAATGGSKPHTHPIPGNDNRPLFLELHFIIRVK